jgi:hypothetical protein
MRRIEGRRQSQTFTSYNPQRTFSLDAGCQYFADNSHGAAY